MQTDESNNPGNDQDASANYNQDSHTMSPQLDAISRWLAVSHSAYIIAAIVTVIATFGVVYFSGKYTRIKELELENYKHQSDLRIAEADRKAAGSVALAAAAQADTAKSQREIEELKTAQEKLKTERTEMTLRLHGLEQSSSKLSETNAQAQEKIKRLEEAQKPRKISEEQKVNIVKLLRAFKGQTVELHIYGQNHETILFAQQITAILQEAGIVVNSGVVVGSTAQGFGVVVHDAKSPPPLAGTIVHAFSSEGIPVDGVTRPDIVPNEGQFLIVIGERVPPR
ncbi:MAG TPA: hypothetical protein VG759_08055 [Candidatus Angelobacter sp.]|nr:hypothetical protein [Candidatus Angelobacter sp.]